MCLGFLNVDVWKVEGVKPYLIFKEVISRGWRNSTRERK
jgi:hypothetical protein